MPGRPPMMMGMGQQMAAPRRRRIALKTLVRKPAGAASQGMRAANPLGAQNARAGGSMMQTLTNPASINGFLTNTQKILNTANQVGPIVQQYGPIVKNLPAMWRLYRGLKNAPDANTEENEVNTTANKATANKTTANKTTVNKTTADAKTGLTKSTKRKVNTVHTEKSQEKAKSKRNSPYPQYLNYIFKKECCYCILFYLLECIHTYLSLTTLKYV